MNNELMSVEDVLSEKGYIVISTAGNSMMPMLRDRKDTVEICKIDDAPKKYDVVLFKKKEKYVLHRIIKVNKDGYIIRGDNCVEKDTVNIDDVIGILFSYTKDGKRHTVKDKSYFLYSRFIVLVHPAKTIVQRIISKTKRILSCK